MSTNGKKLEFLWENQTATAFATAATGAATAADDDDETMIKI